jgi:hypothetical protein
MKYFKTELWKGFNSDIKEEVENSKAQWDENNKEYEQIFEVVKRRLPKTFLSIYMKERGFHDYKLRNFQVIHEMQGFKNPISVVIEIENGEKKWHVVYKEVTRVEIDYKDDYTDESDKRRLQYGFDDYGYDEFLEVNDKILSHEILFASDANILVHFKKISIKNIK